MSGDADYDVPGPEYDTPEYREHLLLLKIKDIRAEKADVEKELGIANRLLEHYRGKKPYVTDTMLFMDDAGYSFDFLRSAIAMYISAKNAARRGISVAQEAQNRSMSDIVSKMKPAVDGVDLDFQAIGEAVASCLRVKSSW